MTFARRATAILFGARYTAPPATPRKINIKNRYLNELAFEIGFQLGLGNTGGNAHGTGPPPRP